MKVYTAFCRDDTEIGGTTWIERIEADNADAATIIAEAECADAWGYEGDERENVTCFGLASGDVSILFWED